MNMLQVVNLLRLLSAATIVVSGAESGRHASIKSKYGQLVTSSTLHWRHVTATRGGMLPPEAVPSGTGNPSKVICRAEHHGSLLVGQTTQLDGQCAVGFLKKMYKKEKFEILINIDRAARLEWRPYTQFDGVPEGAVAGVDESSAGSASGDRDIFIGRHLSSDTGRYRPGTVEVPRRSSYSSFGVMNVFDDSSEQMERRSSGDVLVEAEPIRYELEVHDDDVNDASRRSRNRKKVSRMDVVLAKSSLFRFDEGRDVEARLQKVLSYSYETSVYYGQVPGMIRALPITVRSHTGQTRSILWGLPDKSRQEETLMVGHSLKHHSAVDVSIVGVRITEEVPYKATLISVFPDGKRRTRNVEGVHQRKYLNNIRPEYSRVYKIKDSGNNALDADKASTPPPPPPSKSSTGTVKNSYSYEMVVERQSSVAAQQQKRDDANEQEMLSDQIMSSPSSTEKDKPLFNNRQEKHRLKSNSGVRSCRSTSHQAFFSLVAAHFLLLNLVRP